MPTRPDVIGEIPHDRLLTATPHHYRVTSWLLRLLPFKQALGFGRTLTVCNTDLYDFRSAEYSLLIVGSTALAMPPQFLDLSTELVIQILSYGSLQDIRACARSSRRICDIISGSLYLQYLIRMKVAGVCDPFLPGPSIRERLSTLKRWESAWHSLDLREPTLQCEVPRDISAGVLHYEIHDGYLIGFRR